MYVCKVYILRQCKSNCCNLTLTNINVHYLCQKVLPTSPLQTEISTIFATKSSQSHRYKQKYPLSLPQSPLNLTLTEMSISKMITAFQFNYINQIIIVINKNITPVYMFTIFTNCFIFQFKDYICCCAPFKSSFQTVLHDR